MNKIIYTVTSYDNGKPEVLSCYERKYAAEFNLLLRKNLNCPCHKNHQNLVVEEHEVPND